MNKVFFLFLGLYFFVLLSSFNKDKAVINKCSQLIDTTTVQYKLYRKGKKYLKTYKHELAYTSFHESYLKAKSIPDSLLVIKSLYNLATIDYYNSDYISCEHNIVQALNYRPSKCYVKYSLLCYNVMGLNLKAKANHTDAINYFNKYRDIYLRKKDTMHNFITYANNMGMVYQDTKEFQKAIYYYNQLVEIPNIKEEKPELYARAIDNKAWSLYMNMQYEKAFPLFIQAKDIRLKIDDKPGLVMSYFHLGSFYNYKKESIKATDYALKSLQVAESIGDLKRKLEVLFLLSEINNTKSHFYFEEYKELKEQLIEKERQFKHQTSRIRYESAEKEAEIRLQKINVKSKNKIIFWVAFASILFAISSLLFFFQKKKITKQKEHIQKLQTEVHHTAKNNLAMALNFISKLKEQPSPEAFIVLEKRLQSMSLLHEILYKKEGNSQLVLQEYIKDICDALHISYSSIEKEILYKIEIKQELPYKKATYLGIIINELVTNIYKYAFEGRKEGFYSILTSREQGKTIITVTDNGVGLPSTFNIDNLTSYGLIMIKGLIDQNDWQFENTSTKGKTEFQIII